MKIALPLAEGSLAMHFGHCDQFAVIEVNERGTVLSREDKTPPPHEPGVLPAWLHEFGVTHVIAGGMGGYAQDLFRQNGILVIVGAQLKPPEELASDCARGLLENGDNTCSH